MILPTKQHSISKRLFEEDSSSDEEGEEFESEGSEMFEDETDDESNIQKLKNCWKGLAPPTKETGRWYAAIYTTKKTKRLYIGRLLKRFLKDEDGAVDSIQLHCLKPKVRSGTRWHCS
eukprot:TCONS_00033114-protein